MTKIKFNYVDCLSEKEVKDALLFLIKQDTTYNIKDMSFDGVTYRIFYNEIVENEKSTLAVDGKNTEELKNIECEVQ